MKNQITAKVEFSFKGEVFSPSATIDLDQVMARQDPQPSFHLMIAQKNKIDTFSYLYEVMEQAEVIFTDAQGIATEFLNDCSFNFLALQDAWHESTLEQMYQEIADTEMGADAFDRHPGLKNALVKAYELGKKGFT
jgi:hypothetical protein